MLKKNHTKLFFNPSILTIVLGSLSLACYLILAFNSQYYGDLEYYFYLTLTIPCALMSFIVWGLHHYFKQSINLFLLIGFAIAFRIVGLFTFPILEDDFYRYLWDAYQTWAQGSPYGSSPSTYFDAPLTDRFEVILGAINYPDIGTVYGPLSQWIFALAYLISPGEVWPLKLIFTLFDLGVILLLLKLAKPNSVLLYAWCPLVIKEFCITAHPDIAGVFFVVAALVLHKNKHFLWAAAALALAAGVKVFALLLLPFFIQFYWRSWFTFIATAVMIALPFGVQQAWLPSGLSAMGSDWLFNAPLYLLLGSVLSIQNTKLLLLSILALFCIVQFLTYMKKRHSTSLINGIKGEYFYLLLFFCSPVFNPWYLVWLLPFAVLRPTPWAWVLSVTILFSYGSGINLATSKLGPYEHPSLLMLIEFIPVILAIVFVKLFNYYYKKRAMAIIKNELWP